VTAGRAYSHFIISVCEITESTRFMH